MHCTLYIPHLIPPREIGETLWRAIDAPPIKRMLDRAAFTVQRDINADALLCNLFHVPRQPDSPIAALLASRHDLNAPNGYWLCATPVHLESRRNALVLSHPATLAITAAESAAFTATLAVHLRDEHITLHAPQPDQWLLHCDATPSMTTTSLGSVTGRDVRTWLPKGTDSARWHRILTEIQMLLHVHPLNDAREARGLAPVNSVWLWGGGTLPPAITGTPPLTQVFTHVWSDDATVQALAHHCGSRIERSLAKIAAESLPEGSHFFSLESLADSLRNGDAQAWHNAATALNRDWLTPFAGNVEVTPSECADADKFQR